MLIVLNEWIFHDLWGENGELRQQEAERFLRALVQSADILIVPNESRWTGKANHLMRFSDSRRRVISKVFRSLYSDSERALRVWPESTEAIPIETLSLLPDEDVYLVSAYLSANADVLVTADVPLYESLADSDLVTCQMRDDFLADYGP